MVFLKEIYQSDAIRLFLLLSVVFYPVASVLRSPLLRAWCLRKARLLRLFGLAGDDARYQLVRCRFFTIELVVVRSRFIGWPRAVFHCRFHQQEAVPFQFVSGKKPKSWLLHQRLTQAFSDALRREMKYYYQGDGQQLDAAVTLFVPELGTVRPKSLVDGVFVCEWWYQEENLLKPEAAARMELAHALQKIAMMATRMAGGTFALGELADMIDARHHWAYRRRALIMLFDGYTRSAEGRAALAKEPLSQWHEFAVPVAYSLGLTVDEVALQRDFQSLSAERRSLFFSILLRVHLYPGADLTTPTTLSHELLSAWLGALQTADDRVSVRHLTACYYEGILPPELVLRHIIREDDPRTTGFLADVVLGGPTAHVAIAVTVLSQFDLSPRSPDGAELFPQLSDADHDSLLRRLGFQKASETDAQIVEEKLNRPAHLDLGEALANPYHFKMLLRRLQDEDDRACIPHLIACFHLPHMREEILTFIGRAHDQRVEFFLHDVLSFGSAGEVKHAVHVLRYHGTRLSLAPLQETRRRQGRVHRELIDDAVAAINQRYPAFAEAGALSPVAPLADGAVSLVGNETRQGTLSRLDTPADDGQVSLEPPTPDGEESHRPV